MADELNGRERALRRLPLPYSLALRLREAGVDADLICQYVNVEQAGLDGLYRMAEAKLLAAQNAADGSTTAATDDAGPLPPPRREGGSPRWRLSSTAPTPGEIAVGRYCARRTGRQ